MKTPYKTIDQYIETFPEDIQDILQKIRQTIQRAAAEATEAISYQMPTFKLNGNLVHFAAFKNHIGFYPIPSGIEAFKDELLPYIAGKGSIRFPLDKPIPYDLVKRIVEFRVKENLAKKADNSWKTCSRGHRYQGNGPCPICWPGYKKRRRIKKQFAAT
jgi:uncharacterized protein YdhG (YjbR/CyaY superfamily)